MKERAIVFKRRMIHAILSGQKTQTRQYPKGAACPYGKRGDRLWVRERFNLFDREGRDWPTGSGLPKECPDGWHVIYRADVPEDTSKVFPFRPSVHMPRWASRITLEIVRVRMQRLQDITDRDVREEGITTSMGSREAFRALWESTYGKCGWFMNPSVWVIEFKRINK